MKKALLLITIFFAPFMAKPQTKTFTSAIVGRVTQFTSKSDTISFSDYVETKPRTFERFVFINDDQYRFVKIENNGAEVQEIFDRSGNKVATIPLNGSAKNNIRFTDGGELKFLSTGKTTWSYTKDGKDAIRAFYYLLDEKKHYAVQWEDTTITNSVIPAVVLEYSLATKHVYRNKKKTGAIIAVVGISTALAIMRLAIEDDNDL